MGTLLGTNPEPLTHLGSRVSCLWLADHSTICHGGNSKAPVSGNRTRGPHSGARCLLAR